MPGHAMPEEKLPPFSTVWNSVLICMRRQHPKRTAGQSKARVAYWATALFESDSACEGVSNHTLRARASS